MTLQTCHRVLPADRIVQDPDKLRWGVVSTVKAPLADIARFAAWHLSLGATRIDLYLDAPEPTAIDFLQAHPALDVLACDDAYWQGKPQRARSVHQLRQAYNASRSYRHTDLHWLAHLDVDEFLLAPGPVAQMLAKAPADCACLHLAPCELLASPGPSQHFKHMPKTTGQPKDLLYALYPEFGALLPQGFISYTSHKVFARTGFDPLRFGIHQITEKGIRINNVHRPAGAFIGHAHAPSFDHFRAHMAYRLHHGSYRDQDNGNRHLHGVLTLLQQEQGEAGLRRLFHEICTARPELLDQLRAHDMLITMQMNLDALVSEHFGPLP